MRLAVEKPEQRLGQRLVESVIVAVEDDAHVVFVIRYRGLILLRLASHRRTYRPREYEQMLAFGYNQRVVDLLDTALVRRWRRRQRDGVRFELAERLNVPIERVRIVEVAGQLAVKLAPARRPRTTSGKKFPQVSSGQAQLRQPGVP